MKKRSIQKLSLNKASVSKLNAEIIKGGTAGPWQSVYICQTIDYTRCRGERDCQIYQTPTDQTF
ncbi:MAG: hypothetical protein AAF617_01820 [Bacteroidota bacterium]